jgi:hypothetical protein
MLTVEQGAALHGQIAMALQDADDGLMETVKTRLRRLQELVDDVVPDVDREHKPFTVIGFWRTDDTRHVVGVVEGEHDVMGGVEPNDRGLFAEQVYAENWEAAEEQVHGTTENDEEEEDDE